MVETRFSDRDEGIFSGLSDGNHRHAPVEGNQTSAVGDSESQEVNISNLSWTRQPTAIHHGVIKQTYVVGDEPVMWG